MSRRSQNHLFDMHDRLARQPDEAARWIAAKDIFGQVGADWVTAGTAPVKALHSVAVATSTPSSLMADYISEKIYETDPWMSHSSSSSAIDEVSFDNRSDSPLVSAEGRLLEVLFDNGVRHVSLIPAWTGLRPGAVVLYASSVESVDLMRSQGGKMRTRRIVDTVAAWFRPERLASGHIDTYAIRPVLNRRELEALKLLSLGFRTAEIAWRMGIENVTVSKHFASARKKLSARTREQALAIAIRDRLIQL